LTQWHPILGWFSSGDKSGLTLDVQETTPLVKQQLAFLWTNPLAQKLTACLPMADRDEQSTNPRMEAAQDDKNLVTAFKRAMGNSKSSKNHQVVNKSQLIRKVGSPEVTQVALVACMYQTALCTLTQMRMDILTGNNLNFCLKKKVMISVFLFRFSVELQRTFPSKSLALYKLLGAQ